MPIPIYNPDTGSINSEDFNIRDIFNPDVLINDDDVIGEGYMIQNLVVDIISTPPNAQIKLDGNIILGKTTPTQIIIQFVNFNDIHTLQLVLNGHEDTPIISLRRRVTAVEVANSGNGSIIVHDIFSILPLRLDLQQIEVNEPDIIDHVLLFESNLPLLTTIFIENQEFDLTDRKIVPNGSNITLRAPEIPGYFFLKWLWGNDDLSADILESERLSTNTKLSTYASRTDLSEEEQQIVIDLSNRLIEINEEFALLAAAADEPSREWQNPNVTINVTSNLLISAEYVVDLTGSPASVSVPPEIIINVPESETQSFTFEIPHTANEFTDKIFVANAFKILEFPASGPITLDFFSDFRGEFNNYTIGIAPINNDKGSGETTYTVVKFILEQTVAKMATITYPKILRVPSFSNNELPFTIEYTTISATEVVLDIVGNSNDNLPIASSNAGVFNLNFKNLQLDYGTYEFSLTPKNENGNGERIILTIEFLPPTQTLTKEAAEIEFLKTIDKAFLPIQTDYVEVSDDDKLLKNVINFGNDEQHLITTWVGDDITYENDLQDLNKNGSVILKLYEPLPNDFNVNDLLWISKEVMPPTIRQITLTGDPSLQCNILKPANFSIDVDGIDGRSTGYKIYDELVASGSITNQQLIDQYIGSNVINLDKLSIDFTNFDNFVHFSSAEERIVNFKYKKELLEYYGSKVNEILSYTSSFMSPTVRNEKLAWDTKVNEVIANFDSYEKHLYNNSGSTTWPKVTGSINYPTTSSEGIDWFVSQSTVAKEFDKNNVDWLNNNIPVQIKDNTDNDEFLLFNSMIGHHYDILWTYIKAFENLKKVENKKTDGIPNEMISYMLSSLGWKVRSNNSSADLWNYAFGLNKDGSTSSKTSAQTRSHEIWRRMLTNLPYLLKHKGSSRAIKALIACYGVPSSIISIREYGGPNVGETDTDYIFENNTFGLTFTSASYLDIPFYNTNLLRKPDSIEFHFKTSEDSSNYNLFRLISGSTELGSLDLVGNTTSGSFGRLSFTISGSTISSSQIPLFNDEFYTVNINRTSASTETFDLWVKSYEEGSINQSFTGSITVPTTNWDSATYVRFGQGFVGTIDEFRLWRIPLSLNAYNQHVYFRESYVGNHVSASTDDLLLRLNFESASNLGAANPSYVSNEAIITSYATYVTASDFSNSITFPYNYENFTRMNLIKYPNIGSSRQYNNKIRFEDQELISDLNYKQRSTLKSFDQAPIDSNRVGVFFAPTDQINMDIIRSIGNFNFDNYIGDPEDRYNTEYKALETLRNYYWNRFDAPFDFWDYIKLIKQYDRTMFDYIKDLIPARSILTKGLLIEPNILERNKVDWKRVEKEDLTHETLIDVDETAEAEAQSIGLEAVIPEQFAEIGEGDRLDYLGIISESMGETVTGNTPFYNTTVTPFEDIDLIGSPDFYSVTIDADLREPRFITAINQYGNTIIGMTPWPGNLAFGMFPISGSTELLYYDGTGALVRARKKVRLVTETITELVYMATSGSDNPEVLTEVTRSVQRLNILPIDSTNTDGIPVTNYLPGHYKFVKDTTKGLENSFHFGCKQTSETTLDGSEPIEVFIANPNTLRVNKSGRDSSEPILEVD